MAHAKIIYADCDQQRASTVTDILIGAGYAVWSCSGEAMVSSAASASRPDLVLLCRELDESLHSLAATLWPEVPMLVLNDCGDQQDLPLLIDSFLRKP